MVLLKGFWQNLPPSEGCSRFPADPHGKGRKEGISRGGNGQRNPKLGKIGKNRSLFIYKTGTGASPCFYSKREPLPEIPGLFLIPHLLHSRCSKTKGGAWKKGRERLNPRGKKLGRNIPSSRFLPGPVSLGNENFLIGFSWWEVRKIPCLVGENWDFLQPWDVFHLEIPRDGLENEMSRWEVGNSSSSFGI